MDMNWIDEIRDPEPRKRYIYNADDYDPQYGDPYYREHSTRADSLWRLYEESGTSITFDAFADESRQTDYRMETGALRDFFNGSQSALSSYKRMGDEYTSLYEQDTTGIKGGDFERFGAFADNHLDFIRALTKARGMDPISSDREIGAFLNTFDKLAAMPEPTPAKQEKDELSAGACDPADPLNLEQSSSYGMTR